MTRTAHAVEAIALLDEPVRRDLYDWVTAQPHAVGRDAAAAALGITRALAAFHLDRLARAELLETEFRRLTGRSGPGAGRPAKLYRRSERELEVSLPGRRYALAAELFARALDRCSPEGRASLTAVAHEAGVAIGRSGRRGRGGSARAMPVLADIGYEPVVDSDGTVRLRNCPFHALVDTHRELICGMNLSLAKGIVEGIGAPELEPRLDPQQGWCCVALPSTVGECARTEEAGSGDVLPKAAPDSAPEAVSVIESGGCLADEEAVSATSGAESTAPMATSAVRRTAKDDALRHPPLHKEH